MNGWFCWIADWKKKTAHLPVIDRGAYRELLDHYYISELPLPKDKSALYRIAGAHAKDECAAVDRVISQFFTATENGYTNPRVVEELAKRSKYTDSQRERAHKRWAKEEELPHKGNGSAPIVDETPIVERIPLVGGVEFAVHSSYTSELERLYPSVDVTQTLREIRGWCLGNPTKRKTQRGVQRFINSWMAREQDK